MIAVRKAVASDMEAIMECYADARRFMRACGNLSQWAGGYPSRELIADDIRRGQLYVGEDAEGALAVVFAFIRGDDPTYAVIEDGAWPDNRPYGTIHRIASTGRHAGMLRRCVEFCFTLADSLRLDTHADNLPMQRAAAGLGFARCGIIHLADGAPRIAYALRRKKNQGPLRAVPE